MEKKLQTIQKRNNLNEVFVVDSPDATNNGCHVYKIVVSANNQPKNQQFIYFQNGPRHSEHSLQGVLDVDLLEIARHRLQGFQSGPFACRENALALTHIEEALLWLNKRVEDRAEAGTLGTNKI